MLNTAVALELTQVYLQFTGCEITILQTTSYLIGSSTNRIYLRCWPVLNFRRERLHIYSHLQKKVLLQFSYVKFTI